MDRARTMGLPGEPAGEKLVDRMVEVWLKTDFEGGHHARRVEKITNLEVKRDDK